jgi:hypothetical protein
MDEADDLLQRALIDAADSAAVALRVDGLSTVSEAMTIIFHGRRDLGTIQTYVANGGRGAGAAVTASELLRVPCDLDLADAGDRDEAEALYSAQAAAIRDAIVAADTVLAIWADALVRATGRGAFAVERGVTLDVRLPAHRLMPVALTDPDRHLTITPVCGARTLAEGRPPLGIACAQQDVSHVYPLPDDPDRCIEDFLERAHDHALWMGDQLSKQENSVRRFLELNGEDVAEAG